MSTIHQQVAQTIRQNQNELAETTVARLYEGQSEVWKPFGDTGRAKVYEMKVTTSPTLVKP